MLRNKEIRILVASLTATCGTFTIICFLMDHRAGWVSLAALIAPFILFYFFTRSRYRKLSELADLLGHYATGDFTGAFSAVGEGELSILHSELYKMAVRLTEQSKVLEKEKSALKDNLSDITHQLKTPLTSLFLISELLEKEDLPLVKRKEFCSNLRAGLSRMEWLTISLLKFARLEAEAVVWKKEEISAEDLTEICLQQTDILLLNKKQHIKISGSQNIKLNCDIDWTAEAVVNIIKNASERTPENGEIFISWEEDPLAVRILVEDHAGGIEQKELPHIFERFYRAGSASENGAGIGLPLALAIIRRQNGDITVRNMPGKGAVFELGFYK